MAKNCGSSTPAQNFIRNIVIRNAVRTLEPQDASAAVKDFTDEFEIAMKSTNHMLHNYPDLLREHVADAYLDWMLRMAETKGAVLVAESNGTFVGFVAGWIEESENIGETADSNRVGYISDICVMPEFRGRRVATHLLNSIEQYLGRGGVGRLRINSLAANKSARASYERFAISSRRLISARRW